MPYHPAFFFKHSTPFCVAYDFLQLPLTAYLFNVAFYSHTAITTTNISLSNQIPSKQFSCNSSNEQKKPCNIHIKILLKAVVPLEHRSNLFRTYKGRPSNQYGLCIKHKTWRKSDCFGNKIMATQLSLIRPGRSTNCERLDLDDRQPNLSD